MMKLQVACAEAAETLPFHGTHGKSLNLLQFSPYMLKGFRFKKKGIILFVLRLPHEIETHLLG